MMITRSRCHSGKKPIAAPVATAAVIARRVRVSATDIAIPATNSQATVPGRPRIGPSNRASTR
jgi:hypothetical protein